MVNEWIKPIYNRTYADVQLMMSNPDNPNTIGAYNDFDPNRVEHNTAYCLEYMLEHKIIRAAPSLRIKTNWTENEIVVASEMKRIVENVAILRSLSNPEIIDRIPELHLATQMNYLLANDIEKALDIMHNQPELPAEYFEFSLTDGLILSVVRLNGKTERINSNVCLMAENEVATITAVAPEPDAEYKAFTNWSGETDDLQYLGDVYAATTTYIGQYHDVSFTANFKSAYPRTLSLTNAYISLSGDDKAESGPRSGIYHAGDSIMVIADIAPSGKAFYEWLGTQAAIDSIEMSDTDPSTIWLVMPDCDVELHPRYINAGQHYVTVTDGSGSGWYNYGETVDISANIPTDYGFDNWSGATEYLEDIYSSSQSFKMPDINISLRANSSYRPGYYNVQIINGLINGSNMAYNVMEGSTLTLTPTPPSAQYSQVRWTVEGAGRTSGNTFYVGKGNAIITGTYSEPPPPPTYYTLTVINRDNAGRTETYTAREGSSFTKITTSSRSGNYYFRRWLENGASISTSTSITLSATSDRTITAEYEYVEPPPPPVYTYYTVTVYNKGNDPEYKYETTIRENNTFKDTVTGILDDYILEGYYVNGKFVSVSTDWSREISEKITSNTVITYVYRLRETYTVYVINGYVDGPATKKERETVTIVADSAATKTEFAGWNVTSGSAYSVGGGSRTSVTLGRSNVTVKATYRNLYDVKIVTNTGTVTYTGYAGKTIYDVSATPLPTEHDFGNWLRNYGTAKISNQYSSVTNISIGDSDSEIQAIYTPIPDFNITVINGYVQIGGEWVTKGLVKRNSNPNIKMKPAPTNHQFLQWEILTGSQNDVYQPLAETTYLRNVTHDITVRATYYKPNPEVLYTLTITQKDGTIETYNAPAGERVEISAQWPDEGYKFYRWNGDYQYLVGGRYASENLVNMPEKNIALQPTYVREDFVTKYHLYMFSAECITDYDEDGEPIWNTDGEFEAGTRVQIRAIEPPLGWRFNIWEGETREQTATVHDLESPETYLTMPEFDVYMSATVIEELKYTLKITDGQTSGEYYGGARADVYFSKEDTETDHYSFVRWTGDVLGLELYDGGQFDVTKAGTANEPQYIRMPFKRVELTATYTSAYRVLITGGHIEGTQEQYFPSGTTLNISADIPEGQIFKRWEGDTDGIGNPLSPNTTLVTGNSAKQIVAIYSNINDRNDIGYGLISFIPNDIINIEDIHVISGTIRRGFIVSDIYGHQYLIVALSGDTANIVRMTKIDKGGEVYE